MELSDEVLKTQFYDKVEDYKTLEYNENNCKLQKYEENKKTIIKYLLILKLLHLKQHICHIYVGSIMMIYRKNLLVLIIVLLIC